VLGLVLAGLRLVRSRERTPIAYWIGGWISAAIGGLLLLIANHHPALDGLGLPFGTLFPWFLLAGALVLAERPVPAWLLPLGLGLGSVRSLLAGLGFEEAGYLVGFVTDLPAVLGAAVYARRAIPRAEASATQRALPGALVVLTGIGALHLLIQALEAPQDWLLALWMFVTPPMLGLQLRVGAEWTRRHLVLARRELEHTIAVRTAGCLWTARLSRTTTSPARRVGTRT
jgi:hypothetical protein